jgi:hypothetical protein
VLALAMVACVVSLESAIVPDSTIISYRVEPCSLRGVAGRGETKTFSGLLKCGVNND